MSFDAASEPAIIPKSVTGGTIRDAAGRHRYDHIDALRAYSVLIVVLAHTFILGLLGDSGVTIFFTVSGFIITWLMLRERDRTGQFNPLSFWRRRLLKLMPPLLVIVLVPSVIYAVWRPIDTVGVLSQALFCFNWVFIYIHSAHRVLPGSDPVWSLAVEEQFYIAFAVFWIVTIKQRHQHRAVTLLAVAAIVVANAVRFFIVNSGHVSIIRLERGTDTRMDALALGVLAALLYHAFTQGRVPWLRNLGRFWVLLAAVLVYLLSEATHDVSYRNTVLYTVQPFAAATVILYGLLSDDDRFGRAFHRVCQHKVVATIGLASYSIYLLNDIAITALSHPLRPIGSLPSKCVEIVVSVTGGVAVYYLIEVPVLRLKVRRGW